MQDSKTWIEGQPSPYQLHDLTHFPDWHSLIVLDAFFNNLTSGLMLCTAIIWFCDTPLSGLLPLCLTAALLLLVIDLGILIRDLGDPPRFIHSLRVMRFTSPLSVGVWGLTSYGAFLSVATLLAWIMHIFPGGSGLLAYLMMATLHLCLVMATMGAVVVICYKGVVFSCSSQPGLCHARWLTPFMISDSLFMGMSVFTLLCFFFSPDGAACIILLLPLVTLLGARSIAFALVWQDVKARARKVYTTAENRRTTIFVYGLGSALPLLCMFMGPFGMALASILYIATGLYERWRLIGLARPI